MKSVYSYIRWSAEQQSLGDSERRQVEMARNWCAQHGVELSETTFADRGVSAFKGKNREGRLGALIKTVNAGDVLLIEDNDRFSREDTVTALNNLRDIVNRGVKVVFLKTGLEITRDNFNDPAVLFPNFFQAHLANAESIKKKFRNEQAWLAQKARVAKGVAPRQNLPSWLKWDRENDKVVVREGKTAAVRRVFELYLKGNGISGVARQLIKEGVPYASRVRKTATWQNGYVHRLLTNKAVIGWCLHVDPAVPGIYPSIISEADFWAAQARLKSKKFTTVRERFADSNLFTGLAVCAKCGGSLTKHSQRRGEKIWPYLVCNSSLHGSTDCGLASVRYDRFERSFLSLIRESTLVSRLLGTDYSGEKSKVDELKGRLQEADRQAEKLLRLIEGDENPSKTLAARLKEFELKAEGLREQVQLEEARALTATPPAQAFITYREFADRMAERDYRLKAKALFRDMVSRIVVELGQDRYEVHLRGTSLAITVIITPSGHLISPSPREV